MNIRMRQRRKDSCNFNFYQNDPSLLNPAKKLLIEAWHFYQAETYLVNHSKQLKYLFIWNQYLFDGWNYI